MLNIQFLKLLSDVVYVTQDSPICTVARTFEHWWWRCLWTCWRSFSYIFLSAKKNIFSVKLLAANIYLCHRWMFMWFLGAIFFLHGLLTISFCNLQSSKQKQFLLFPYICCVQLMKQHKITECMIYATHLYWWCGNWLNLSVSSL